MLGQDVNLKKCRGFLVDGDHSTEWRKAPPTPSLERSVSCKALRAFFWIRLQLFCVLQGTLPFMSLRLLSAWDEDQPIVHTAVDDLESFLWVLVWALVHILKEFGTTTRNSTVDQLAERFSSYSIPEIMMKESTIQRRWKDVVFGGLIREWLAISLDASLAVEEHVGTVFGSRNDVDLQQGAFDRLEEYCRTVYMKFIRAGNKHLESIRRYSDWKAVVDANPGWLK